MNICYAIFITSDFLNFYRNVFNSKKDRNASQYNTVSLPILYHQILFLPDEYSVAEI